MELYSVQKIEQGFLSVMPYPGKNHSLESDIISLKSKGVDVIVSFLQPEELNSLGLEEQENICYDHKILYLNFPIEDSKVPNSVELSREFIFDLLSLLKNGKHLALHCKGGVGRTGTFAGALMKLSGVDPEFIFSILSEARGKKMPATAEQKDWVLSL